VQVIEGKLYVWSLGPPLCYHCPKSQEAENKFACQRKDWFDQPFFVGQLSKHKEEQRLVRSYVVLPINAKVRYSLQPLVAFRLRYH
jgi:hypothetical protein